MRDRLDGIAAAFRQLAFPREFRIDEPGDGCVVEELEIFFASVALEACREEKPPETTVEPALDPAHVRKLANVTWNLMGQAKTLGETSFDRALKGRVDILKRILEDVGIEMIDYTGQDYDDGEIWDEVLGSEGRKMRPVIVSMSRPRVKYRTLVVQRGMPVIEDRDAESTGGDPK